MAARPDARKRVPPEGPAVAASSTSIGNLPKDCTISLCSNTPRLRQPRRDFRHRLEDAGFIIGGHDRHEGGVGPNRPLKLLGIDQALARQIEPRDLETFPLFQMLQRVQNGMMFGTVADQMLSLWRETPGETEEREVVRFRAAARENDFVRFHA